MTRISLSAACILLISAGAALAQSQSGGHEAVMSKPFNAAAYPFGQVIPSSANTGKFHASGVPKNQMNADRANDASVGTGM